MPTSISPLTIRRVTYTGQGGDSLTFNIPNDYNISAFGLRVTGNITVGTAVAAGVNAGGCSNFFKNIRVLAKSEQRLDVKGRELRLLNLIHNQSSIEQTDPPVTVATSPFSITLQRQFQMPRMLLGNNDQGILPNNLIRDVQVVVDIGLPTDILPAGGGGSTVVYSGTITVEFYILQAIPTPVNPAFYVNEQVMAIRDTVSLTTTGEKTIKMNVGGLYRHIILYAESTSGGVISYDDTLIDQIRLVANRTELLRQNAASIQSDNQSNFLLTNRLRGVFVLDFTRTFTPAELLDTTSLLQSGYDFNLLPTVIASAATSTFGIVSARIFGTLLPSGNNGAITG